VGQCTVISLAFFGQAGKEIAGVFGSDASVSFYILTPADLSAIQNPTCSLPASSRPLYSEVNVVGFDNSYRSLPFPADGTYFFVFVLGNTGGVGQIAKGYADVQLTYPASTTLARSETLYTPSSSSVPVVTTSSIISESSTSTSTIAAAGPSLGTIGFVGVIVAVAAVASILVFMKRGKRPAEGKAVLQQETVKKETKPEPIPQARAQVSHEPKLETPQLQATTVAENISTRYPELDRVLAGGLPIGYAILIVSPPCDERDLLFRKIIESSLSMENPVFFLSRDLIRMQDFANRYGKNFHIFSPQADKITSAGGTVHKIQGLQNLSDLNISFTKTVETLPKTVTRKLVVIDLLSDILLEHKALTTRKWLDDFIGKRKTEGFTIIGVLNPLISSQQDTQTIMDLFDGVIEIYERELKERARRFLIVKKLYGRKYVDSELMLDRDKLYSGEG
jgi:KaiC/GvpD/RAD55 family RecA-like ATPase